MSRSAITLPITFATLPASPSTNPAADFDQNYSSLLNGIYDSSNGFTNALADTGTANVYVVTCPTGPPSLAPSGYANGMSISFLVGNTNTGASTLNVNSLGTVPIVSVSGNALGANALLAGYMANVRYYNGNFYLLNALTSAIINTQVVFATPTTQTVNCLGGSSVYVTCSTAATNGSYILNLTNLSSGTDVWIQDYPAATNSNIRFKITAATPASVAYAITAIYGNVTGGSFNMVSAGDIGNNANGGFNVYTYRGVTASSISGGPGTPFLNLQAATY